MDARKAGAFVADLYCEEAMSAANGERNPMVGGVTQAVLPNDPPGYFLKPEQVGVEAAKQKPGS